MAKAPESAALQAKALAGSVKVHNSMLLCGKAPMQPSA